MFFNNKPLTAFANFKGESGDNPPEASFPNGTEWTLALSSENFQYKEGGVVRCNDGVWVYVNTGTNDVWYSKDGKNLTSCNVGVSFGHSKKIYYANGLWFISGSTNQVYYSTNGKNWSPSSISGIGAYPTICYNEAIGWVAVFEKSAERKNYIYHSNDGMEWTCKNSFAHTSHIDDLCWHNGRLIMAGVTNSFYTDATFETIGSYGIKIRQLSKVGADVYATGNGIYHTRNGETWYQSMNNDDGSFYGFKYANGVMVAGGLSNKYTLLYSTDGGATWKENDGVSLTDPTYQTASAYEIQYENGMWVAATNSGIFTSRDGKTWAATNINDKTGSVFYADGVWATSCNSGMYYSQAWER